MTKLLTFLFVLNLVVNSKPELGCLFSIVDNYFPYKHICFAITLKVNLLVTTADCVLERNASLIAAKYECNPVLTYSTLNLNATTANEFVRRQRFGVRSIQVHGNYRRTTETTNDNIAVIKIENTNAKFVNTYYDLEKNLEFSVDDYTHNVLKSMLIVENASDLTNYILVEQRLNYLNYETCLTELVKEHWYKNNQLSKYSICTRFDASVDRLIVGGRLTGHRFIVGRKAIDNDLKANSKRRINSLIDWNHQRGSPLILVDGDRQHIVGILIKIDHQETNKPLVFLRLSLYFDWLHKFL